MVILTTCPNCAAPLEHNAPRCGSCKKRYCGRDCQKLHWKAHHRHWCERIKRGGGDEQYHADYRYGQAVNCATEACAEETKGQTCYICTEGVIQRTGEALVSGFCACRGGSSYAHVTCLVEQAKVMVAEALENNLEGESFMKRWGLWHTCRLCEQPFYGLVKQAMGWGCYKTYAGRPALVKQHLMSMSVLGNHLPPSNASLMILEALLDGQKRYAIQVGGQPAERNIVITKNTISACYEALGRYDDALRLDREVYASAVRLFGPTSPQTLGLALGLVQSLIKTENYAEARTFIRERMQESRGLGDEHMVNMKLRHGLSRAIVRDGDITSRETLEEAEEILVDLLRTTRRVLGPAYPEVVEQEQELKLTREWIKAGPSAWVQESTARPGSSGSPS